MMRHKEMNCLGLNAKGFTLVEVLLAMVIGTIIMSAVYMATMEGHRASTGIEQKISVQEDARTALDMMAMEIGMASFNPTLTSGIWRDLVTCNAAAANQAYKGIQNATANTITIEMDSNQNGVIGPAEPNEIVTYNYDAANQRITRDTNCPGTPNPQTFLGDVATVSNRQRNVVIINNQLNPVIPVFRYFDSTGSEILPASLPANIPQIRRIDITLVVQAADPDVQGQVRTMSHSTSVIPRNHAIPLYY